MTDEEKGSSDVKYDRVALTEAVDWMDDPSEEAEDQELDNNNSNNNNNNNSGAAQDEDDDEDDEGSRFQDELTSHGTTSPSTSCWTTCFLPDDRFSICDTHFVDGPVAVKLLKFLAVTFGGICLMYKFVRFMNWEHKQSFTLEKFWTYESTQVVSDAIVFFVVARLWKQRGVDHLAWLFWLTVSNIFMSYLPNIQFLQASVTLYDMHCKWSWKLWTFCLVLTPLVVMVVFLHVQYAVRHGFFVPKLLELVLAFVFFFLPYASSPYFHLHHWFAGWWIGQHANYDVWWSRATLAWCYGLFINGIAAYGRDPVLTCGYALFISEQNRCPFLDCYLDGIHHPTVANNDTDVPVVQPMVKPDWRNCSADAYHP